jgi:phosphoacetylglucosamine mutase
VGLVVAIRAKQVGTCGVMITASHNMHDDNGVKIIEPDGSMLIQRWEGLSELIVNH